MASRVDVNMVRQQGFACQGPSGCDVNVSGTFFQPRIVFPLILLATVFAWAPLFLVLSGVLAWNVLWPRWNPLERAYNALIAPRRRSRPVPPAPGPRRFAQGMAAVFTAGAGLALLGGASLPARVFEALLIVAFVALLFGRWCLGAYVFHVLRGHMRFANATLPWARSE